MKSYLLSIVVALIWAPAIAASDNLQPDEAAAADQQALLAQQTDSLKSQIKQLNSSIKSADKSIKDYEKKIDKIQTDLSKLEESFSASKESQAIAKLNDSIAFLIREKGVREELVEKQADSLSRNLACADILARVKATQDANSGLKHFADSVRSYFKGKVDSLVQCKYSALDSAYMAGVMAEMEKYMADPLLQTPYGELNGSLQMKLKYDKIASALQKPYDAAGVNVAIRNLRSLESAVDTGEPGSEAQWAEMLDMLSALEGYGKATENFGVLYQQVKDTRDGYTEKSINVIQDEFLKLTADFETVNAASIDKIPYLKKRYGEYKSAVEKNAFHGDRIADEILSCK